MKSYDYIIIGAGIVGLTIALELRTREPQTTILMLEKEPDVGRHGSGRNSGVLHSGIYYPEESLKEKMCSKGSKLMVEYCDANELPIARLGKVILPIREDDGPQLDLLFHRAKANGARVEMLDERQLYEREPSARTATGKALYSPDTAVVEPKAIVNHLVAQLQDEGVDVQYNAEILEVDVEKGCLTTKAGCFSYGWLFNSFGQYAPRSQATLVKNRIGYLKKARAEIVFEAKTNLNEGLMGLVSCRSTHKAEVAARRVAGRLADD